MKAPFPPVERLLPHRAPMRLVEGIVARLPDGIVCRARLPEGCPLAGDGEAPTYVAIEMAAQAAAVLEALARSEGGEAPSPRVGYLVSVRDAIFPSGPIPVGRPVEVRLRESGRGGTLALYHALVTLGEATLLDATIGTALA